MNIGKTINELRDERRWTQEELAARANITAANISRIENGKHGPSVQLLESLAQAFGLMVYQLIAIAENEKLPAAIQRFDFDESKLLTSFRNMPNEQREIFQLVGASFAAVKKNKKSKV
jgi:transcriptional regulator with XRE-family HTH domain